jgi:RNA polymerase sigma-70 factor (ECF subfamily)
MGTASTGSERGLLDAARGGDQDAYRRLVEPLRPELQAHCYRMLGSVHDAEDALQEALLRAWRGLPRFEGRSSPRTWLHRIATNACLDAVARRPKRVLPPDVGPTSDPRRGADRPLVETVWVEPYPDERIGVEDGFASPDARYERRESVELAFIAALQHLAPRQRAVLILREVLGFSAAEVAETMATSVASVNSALQRARATVAERAPEESQQATLRSLGDEAVRQVVEEFVDAWERGDVEAIVGMLTDDAALTMPPMQTWFRGRADIAEFVRRFALRNPWRLIPTRASGQLAFAMYQGDPDGPGHRPIALDVITLEGPRIVGITAFVTPEVTPRYSPPSWVETFGMPARLD